MKMRNPTQALTRLDEDEQGTLISNEGGPGRRLVNEPGIIKRDDLNITRLALVSESGLYSLFYPGESQ